MKWPGHNTGVQSTERKPSLSIYFLPSNSLSLDPFSPLYPYRRKKIRYERKKYGSYNKSEEVIISNEESTNILIERIEHLMQLIRQRLTTGNTQMRSPWGNMIATECARARATVLHHLHCSRASGTKDTLSDIWSAVGPTKIDPISDKFYLVTINKWDQQKIDHISDDHISDIYCTFAFFRASILYDTEKRGHT